MTRVAVLGANGQVGSEVCLLLAAQPDVALVPICRNPGGSAFLRYHGLAVRHGIPADPSQAPGLLGDADLVANFAFSQALPREGRALHDAMIRNCFEHSPPGAKIVYISTLAAYGRSGAFGRRVKTAYSREKLTCEALARRESERTGKPLWILRLGHVCGELQNITKEIREAVRSGPLALRAGGDLASNTVYTASIVETLLRIDAGDVAPGLYDLVTEPEWSWRRVYAYEAEQIGVPLRLVESAPAPRPGAAARLRGAALRAARRLAAAVQGAEWAKDATRAALARLPLSWNQRLTALHYRQRAASEIAALAATRARAIDLLDPWDTRRALRGLSDPAELRRQERFRLPERPAGFAAAGGSAAS